MADTMSTTGTGPIPTSSSSPMDKLLEQLINSTVAPTINGLLDISATTNKTGTENSTGTKTSTETGTGTKTSSTSLAAQTILDQQIASLKANLTDNNQYGQLVNSIMQDAAKTFNPTNTASRRSGAYNSTTLDQLRNDATAKATAQAAEATLADKRAKMAQLVELIGQNVNANKKEDTSTSQAGTTNANQTNNTNEQSVVEANRIGRGAADVAKVGAAAALAKSLLGTDLGKSMTTKGVGLLKQLFDMSGGSTGLPSNWFEDLSGVVADPNAVSGSYDEAIKSIFGDVNETGLPDGWFEDQGSSLFSDSSTFADLLNSSGVSANSLGGWSGPTAALINASDGEWGWSDTGSTVGTAIGTAIGGPIGGSIGGAVGSAGGESVGNDVENGSALLSMSTLGLNTVIGDLFGGCFLTTACMKHMQEHFDDKCRELEAMRELRDKYIRQLPAGEDIIEAYYLFAPEYVKRIEEKENAPELWKAVYFNYILPCVEYVIDKKYHEAYLTYLNMIRCVQVVTGVGV